MTSFKNSSASTLEITVNNLHKISQKHTEILEALFRFCKVQMVHAEQKDKHLNSLEVRIDKLENMLHELREDQNADCAT